MTPAELIEWGSAFGPSWVALAPVVGLCALGLVVMAMEVLTPEWRGMRAFVTFVGLSSITVFTAESIQLNQSLFGGALVYDEIGRHCFGLILCIGVFITMISPLEASRLPDVSREYHSVLIFALFGMALMSISREFVSLFVSLEIASLSLYVLTTMSSPVERSSEAALKYFLLGAFSSAFVVMGIAFLFGATGTLWFADMRTAAVGGLEGSKQVWAVLGLAFLLAGMSFKLTLVPFHAYAPDVYQGARTSIAALIATGSKVSGFAAVAAIVYALTAKNGDAVLADKTRAVLWILAAASMVVGNLMAVAQPNLKRMLAFSSVAHSGYLVVGLLALTARTVHSGRALLFYLLAYSLMNLLAFGVASTLGRRGETSIAHYAGLARRSPLLALAMALALLSLTGIPPTIGFAGKFMVFRGAVEAGYIWLAVIGVLSSVWSAYYYLRVIVYMYMIEPKAEWPETRVPFANGLALAVCFAFILLLGLAPELVKTLN